MGPFELNTTISNLRNLRESDLSAYDAVYLGNIYCRIYEDNFLERLDDLEEGIALVQTYGRPGESVQGMGTSNPFSFATQRPPAHGGAVNLSPTNIAPSAMPPKKLLIGDVDLLLVPKFPASDRQTLAAVLQSYPELLGSEYLQVAESPNWTLYRRAN